MFLKRYDVAFLREKLLPLEQWRPFPVASDRPAWDELLSAPLNQERRALLTEQATAIRGTPWPQLPASLYMEFHRVGDRHRYEAPYFERRQRLAVLVLAECAIYDGRFLDEIVNGLWCILEELTWCIPAHASRHTNDPLPIHDREHVDLFACETAMILAETLYLLKESLDKLSPSLGQRLQQAIENRVIIPVEKRTDLWWLEGRNNWTPWCASNVLGAAMYLINNSNRLCFLTDKLMRSVDRFIANYGDDGGCDEGPGYWGVAAGAMLVFLEILYSRSNGAVNIYDEPHIRRMGHFIVSAHLAGPWFMNFADAPARFTIRRAVVYQYGRRTGDNNMQNLALLSTRNWQKDGSISLLLNQHLCGGDLTHMLRELFWIPADAEPAEQQLDLTTWLPDVQTLTVREQAADSQGFVLAAKGGHNNESHNHNDIGQFIIFLDGQPGVIDIGTETYCRKTFSDSRYEIWCIRSSGHNVPQVNGNEQCTGREYRAVNTQFTEKKLKSCLTMDIANAYPKAAGIRSLQRQYVFNRVDSAFIIVRDSFEMDSGVPRITIPLFCREDVKMVEQGRLLIATKPRSLMLEYSADVLQAEVTTVPLMDEQLRAIWGPHLHKIEMQYVGNNQADSYELVFRAQAEEERANMAQQAAQRDAVNRTRER